MWSCGVIVYILLGGYPPFHDDNHAVLYRKIKAAEYTFEPQFWDGVSADAKDLIRKMLVLDPDRTPNPRTHTSTETRPEENAMTPLLLEREKDSCSWREGGGGSLSLGLGSRRREIRKRRVPLASSRFVERLTAEQALRHPWFLVGDHELITRNLDHTLATMKKFNARRKFRGAVKAIMLANKLARKGFMSQWTQSAEL